MSSLGAQGSCDTTCSDSDMDCVDLPEGAKTASCVQSLADFFNMSCDTTSADEYGLYAPSAQVNSVGGAVYCLHPGQSRQFFCSGYSNAQ